MTNTGLPELPETYFWRIADEHHIEIREAFPDTEWSEWKDGDYMESHPYSYLGHFESGQEGGEIDTEERLREVDPTTRENVYQRCLETLAAWNEQKDRESLFGDYPPKEFK